MAFDICGGRSRESPTATVGLVPFVFVVKFCVVCKGASEVLQQGPREATQYQAGLYVVVVTVTPKASCVARTKLAWALSGVGALLAQIWQSGRVKDSLPGQVKGFQLNRLQRAYLGREVT